MITVDGGVSRSFIFPAPLPEAFAFYADFARTLRFLRHISILTELSPSLFRVQYSSIEMGIYRVVIICDIRVELDPETKILRICQDKGGTAVRGEAGLYHISSQGVYESESRFYDETAATSRIDYELRMRARLPVPLALRLMPTPLLDGIASSITNWRMGEIIEGFIERSIEHYHEQAQK